MELLSQIIDALEDYTFKEFAGDAAGAASIFLILFGGLHLPVIF